MSIDEKLPPRPPVTFTKQLVDPAQSPRRTLMTHDQITSASTSRGTESNRPGLL